MSTKWLIALILIFSGSISFAVGHATTQRRSDINSNFCVLDRSIVQFMEKQLSIVTKEEASKDVRRWELYRNQDVSFIVEISKISLCSITLKIPPDPLN